MPGIAEAFSSVIPRSLDGVLLYKKYLWHTFYTVVVLFSQPIDLQHPVMAYVSFPT